MSTKGVAIILLLVLTFVCGMIAGVSTQDSIYQDCVKKHGEECIILAVPASKLKRA